MLNRSLKGLGLSIFLPMAAWAAGDFAPPLPNGTINVDPVQTLDTSLRIAAREGRVKVLADMIAKGGNVNATSDFGRTALMYAARLNHTRAVALLLEHGADPNIRDDQDMTALMQASMNCSFRSVRLLLARGADVNVVNHEGRTALIYAARDGCEQVVQLLLAVRGIDLDIRDDGGRTALDYAAAESITEVGGPYSRIARALYESGGKTSFILPWLNAREFGFTPAPVMGPKTLH